MAPLYRYYKITITLPTILAGLFFAAPVHAESIVALLTSPTMVVINGLLVFIREVSLLIVSLAAFLLNKMFWISLASVSSAIPVVPIAWAALRDLANGAFLLIILWISLTIIFGVEQWGGRKLLAKVIMVALLINFSLLMVTITVGAANLLASIFAKHMPTEPGTFIVKAIDAQKLGTIITREELAQVKDQEKKRELETQRQLEAVSEGEGLVYASPVQDALLASLGIPTAQAAGLEVAGCAAGILTAGALGILTSGLGIPASAAIAAAACGVGGGTGLLAGWLSGWETASQTDKAVALSGQILFLLLTAVTMFYGAVSLLIRYAVITALSVLAPLAFLAAMIPSMNKYFDLWVSTLVKWAFFLPTFYLMMYLSFYIISGVAGAASGTGPVSIDRLVVLFVAVLFMWMGLRIAKQTGGAIADSVVGGIAKLGLLATGGAAGLAMKGAGAVMAANPEMTQGLAARARGIPLFGRQIQRAIGSPMEKDRTDVEARQKEMTHFSSDQLASRYKAGTRNEKIAAARLLVERESLEKIKDHKEEAYRLSSNIGMGKELLEADPTLAMPTQGKNKAQAIREAVSKMKDKTKISKTALDGNAEDVKALIEALMIHTSTKQLSQIGMDNKELLRAATKHLGNLNAEQTAALKEEMRREGKELQVEQLTNYFNGSIANNIGPKLGWKAPTGWNTP